MIIWLMLISSFLFFPDSPVHTLDREAILGIVILGFFETVFVLDVLSRFKKK